jgi:imidazolonepropionase-like amidohydrolase
VRAARAVQMERELGTLEPGKLADLAVFPAEDDDPLDRILDNQLTPMEIWIANTAIPSLPLFQPRDLD